jgi:hypothetical protein
VRAGLPRFARNDGARPGTFAPLAVSALGYGRDAKMRYRRLGSGDLHASENSLGSWVTYGLGSVSENLPAYCVMPQPEGVPEGGAPCWGSAYLPAVYQGTLFRKGASPILNLRPPENVGGEQQENTFDVIGKMNQRDLGADDTDLAARISRYELAFRMQKHAPEAVDLAKDYGGTDGHRFVNGVLDKLAARVREAEIAALARETRADR